MPRTFTQPSSKLFCMEMLQVGIYRMASLKASLLKYCWATFPPSHDNAYPLSLNYLPVSTFPLSSKFLICPFWPSHSCTASVFSLSSSGVLQRGCGPQARLSNQCILQILPFCQVKGNQTQQQHMIFRRLKALDTGKERRENSNRVSTHSD